MLGVIFTEYIIQTSHILHFVDAAGYTTSSTQPFVGAYIHNTLCCVLCVCMVVLFEGSAMIEVAFDIASGANFKFNTGILGQEASEHGTNT